MLAILKNVFIGAAAITFFSAAALHAAVVVDGSKIMDQDMGENLCALTFDDGPSPNTPLLLDMLADYNIPATFFLLGRNVTIYPDIVRRMLKDGHEVANHSWSHPNLKKLGYAQQAEQIGITDNILRSLGAVPFYVRPPYGSFNDNTVKVAEELGLSIILWSLDSKDWKRLPEDYARLGSTRGTIYETGELRGIFLFHDTHLTTVEDLPRIVSDLKAGGCDKFVTVSEYLAGISDPEPGSLMTRRPTQVASAPAENAAAPKQPARQDWLKYAGGSGPLPLARSSKPWQENSREKLDLEDAHAAAGQANNGI